MSHSPFSYFCAWFRDNLLRIWLITAGIFLILMVGLSQLPTHYLAEVELVHEGITEPQEESVERELPHPSLLLSRGVLVEFVEDHELVRGWHVPDKNAAIERLSRDVTLKPNSDGRSFCLRVATEEVHQSVDWANAMSDLISAGYRKALEKSNRRGATEMELAIEKQERLIEDLRQQLADPAELSGDEADGLREQLNAESEFLETLRVRHDALRLESVSPSLHLVV
ncbi:MAG: hypothetical protein AAF236_14955, partial [Verrucomicrobiota bacterium]